MPSDGYSTKITYGAGGTLYDFDEQPTPFVTMDQEMLNEQGGPADGRWGRMDHLTINGILTGVAGGDNCANGFNNLVYAQTRLLSGFGKDFQDLVIEDSGIYGAGGADPVYTGHNCIVRNVSFEESTYNGILGYSIQLDAWPKETFWSDVSNAMGVLDPSDSYDFEQDPEDEIVKIGHSVSARGFNTSTTPNALQNAITFVQGRTGYKFEGYVGFPKFIEAGTCGSAGNGGNEGNPDVDDCCFIPILQSQSESINRIEGTYSVSETYEADPSGCSGIILRYTTTLESGIGEDFATATIDAEAKHAKTGDWEELRTYFKDLNFYQLLVDDTNYSALNPTPSTLSVEEYETGRRITFKGSYDDNNLFGDSNVNSYYDYSVSLSTDEITNITSATVNGTIKSRGNLTERATRSSNHLDNVIYQNNSPSYLRTKAVEVYDDFKSSDYSLRLNPNSLSIVSGAKGEIQVNASFDDSYLLDDNIELRDSTYSCDVATALPIFKPKASVSENGLYVIFETSVVNRENFSISTQLVGKHNPDPSATPNAYSAYLEGKANALVTTLRTALGDGSTIRLDGESVNKNDNEALISCNYNYSQDKPSFLSDAQAKRAAGEAE